MFNELSKEDRLVNLYANRCIAMKTTVRRIALKKPVGAYCNTPPLVLIPHSFDT